MKKNKFDHHTDVSKELIAHVKIDVDETSALIHEVWEHLLGTADLSSKFTSAWGMGKIGGILGITHDLGKASKAFQARIRLVTGYDVEAHLEGKTANHVDHSTAAAQYLVKKYGKQAGLLLAYITAGHHSGIPDGVGPSDSTLSHRLKKIIEDYSSLLDWIDQRLPKYVIPQDFLPANSDKLPQIHMLIRMLYSALTDADFLDTEAFMSPKTFSERNQSYTISELEKHYSKFLEQFTLKTNTSPVNLERDKILGWCLDAAEHRPGIFALTVPTGGGKTLSSMAFALKHAAANNKRRIIYVIPYTSIIEQNAEVFKNIFEKIGDDIVLEHHSNLEPKDETVFNRLASQNWDVPIIVTTNVQFFESFYGNRSSSCRKLHNVANSVIIFDEAQMLPAEYLNPSLSLINELVKYYGCSAVICTATQPVLKKSDILREGLENVREIIPNTDELYDKFKRTSIRYQPEKRNLQEIADELSCFKQALVIVNTRKDARIIAEKIAEEKGRNGIYHLSTMMCPAHRRETLNKIRKKLKMGKTCVVVSTQLIEAGVDVDFPVVYRAIAGIDSIAQAAGRCNREGKLEIGEVVVFNAENPPPPGHLRRSADSGKYILKEYDDNSLSLDAVKAYFEDFYGKEKYAHQFDKKGILSLCQTQPDAIPFKQIAKEFMLIGEKTFSLIVPYNKESECLISELRNCFNGFVSRKLRKSLQRYSIQLREKAFLSLGNIIENVFGDGEFYALTNPDIYDEFIGLKPEQPDFLKIESTII